MPCQRNAPPTAVELRLRDSRCLHFDSTMDPVLLTVLIRAVAESLLTRQGAWQRGQTRPDLGLCARSTVRHVAAIGSRANGGRAGSSPLGAVYRFAPNWKEEHVLSHLVNARGILQSPLGTSRCDALPGNGWLQRLPNGSLNSPDIVHMIIRRFCASMCSGHR